MKHEEEDEEEDERGGPTLPYRLLASCLITKLALSS